MEFRRPMLWRRSVPALRGLYVWSNAAQRFTSFHPDLPSGLAEPVILRSGDGVWLDLREPASWVIPAATGMVGGLVTLGPICPVQRADQSCPDAPYEASLVVQDVDGVEVAVGRSGTDGRYQIALAAGEYTIVPQSPVGLPLPVAGPAAGDGCGRALDVGRHHVRLGYPVATRGLAVAFGRSAGRLAGGSVRRCATGVDKSVRRCGRGLHWRRP